MTDNKEVIIGESQEQKQKALQDYLEGVIKHLDTEFGVEFAAQIKYTSEGAFPFLEARPIQKEHVAPEA